MKRFLRTKSFLLVAVLALFALSPAFAARFDDGDGDLPGEIKIPGHMSPASAHGNPIDFPFDGNTKESHIQGNVTAAPFTVLSIPQGQSGVVRNLSFVFSDNPQSAMHVFLNVFYDGNSTPDFSIPIASLLGYETPDAVVQDMQFSTDFFSATASANVGNGSDGTVGNLTYPIPYTNGIKITYTADDGEGHSLWSNIMYQDTLPSSWNSNLRMEISRTNEVVPRQTHPGGSIMFVSTTDVVGTGTNFTASYVGKSLEISLPFSCQDVLVTGVTDTTHLTVTSVDTGCAQQNVSITTWNLSPIHTFFSRPTGEKGWVEAVYAGFTPANNDFTAFLEGNPRVFLNGNTQPDMEWTGTEDYFLSGFYFLSQRFQGMNGGITAYSDITGEITAYRLHKESPWHYTNGILGTYPNVDGAGTVTMRWTVVYYKEI